MDIIQDAWSPCHNVSTILTSIQVTSLIFKKCKWKCFSTFRIYFKYVAFWFLVEQSLLTDPNPASPANPGAAHLYQNDIKMYNR